MVFKVAFIGSPSKTKNPGKTMVLSQFMLLMDNNFNITYQDFEDHFFQLNKTICYTLRRKSTFANVEFIELGSTLLRNRPAEVVERLREVDLVILMYNSTDPNALWHV